MDTQSSLSSQTAWESIETLINQIGRFVKRSSPKHFYVPGLLLALVQDSL